MFGRKGISGTGPARRRVPFETDGNGKFVRNAVPRGDDAVPLDAMVDAIRRSQSDHGQDSLTNLERWILEGYLLEAYAIHQGGFDYYFAHIEGTKRWADAFALLVAMDREEASQVMRQAVELFVTFDHDSADQSATRTYFDDMQRIDRRFTELMPDFEQALATFADRHYPYSDRT